MYKRQVVANAILLLAPFALYEFSERIGGSGLLTVVVAGVWIAHSTGKGSAYRSRLQAVSVWSLITFLLESFAFIVVGVEFLDTASVVTFPDRWELALMSVALTAALLITRGLFMAGWFAIGPTFAPRKFADRKGTAKEFAAIGLLGVRGPVSVLAALSFPLDFPYRNLLLTLTFGVVVLSLLLSLFVTPVIQALHLTTETDAEALRAARIAVSRAALRQLDEDVLEAERLGHPVPEKMERRLRSTAVRRVDSLQASPEQAQAAGNQLRTQRDLQRSMLHAERAELHRLRVDRHAPGHIIAKLTHELDVREAALGQPGRI